MKTRFLIVIMCALSAGWVMQQKTRLEGDNDSSEARIAYVTNGVDPFWDLAPPVCALPRRNSA